MVVYGCGEYNHDGELGEENTVEDEGLGFVPCFKALRNNVAARVYGEGGETSYSDRG